MSLTPQQIESLRSEWTDQYVQANPARPELRRFENRVGRVVTVNHSGRALVDFADGGWYDIAASAEYLTRLDPNSEAAKKFDSKVNSAQPIPDRQG